MTLSTCISSMDIFAADNAATPFTEALRVVTDHGYQLRLEGNKVTKLGGGIERAVRENKTLHVFPLKYMPNLSQEQQAQAVQALNRKGEGEALDLKVEPPLCRIMVKLRLPVAAMDAHCPFCDAIADRYGDHARACPCGGGRAKLHNRLVVAARTRAAGTHTEVEKPGLLPPRCDEGGQAEDGAARGSGRRPADVFLEAWRPKRLLSWTWLTSGMRPGNPAAVADAGDRPTANYEAKKRQHLQTQQLCTNEGIHFIPLVAEGCAGGWAPAAQQLWQQLGRAVAAISGEPASVKTDWLLQRQSHPATAAVRGRDPSPTSGAMSWAKKVVLEFQPTTFMRCSTFDIVVACSYRVSAHTLLRVTPRGLRHRVALFSHASCR